jgi:hypothetical protein
MCRIIKIDAGEICEAITETNEFFFFKATRENNGETHKHQNKRAGDDQVKMFNLRGCDCEGL